MNTIWEPEFTHQDIQMIKEQVLYAGFCPVKRYSFKFRLFKDGWSEVVEREFVSRPAAVAVLLYDPEQDSVVLIEQLRVAAFAEHKSPWLLEIVAGMIDKDETPEACARREVKEESGYDVQTLIPISSYWTSPGISSEKIILYCGLIKASTSGGVFGLVQDGEDIKVHALKAQQAFSLLKEGKIASSPAMISLQWLELNRASFLKNESLSTSR